MLPSDFEYNTWQFKVWQLCNPLLERQSYPLTLSTTPDSLKSGSYVTPHKEDSLTLWLLSVTPDCLKSGNLIPPGSGLACKIKQPSSVKHSTCLESTHKGVISPRKTAHKHNNKDPSHLPQLSPGMPVNTKYINSTRGTALVCCCFFVYIIILRKTMIYEGCSCLTCLIFPGEDFSSFLWTFQPASPEKNKAAMESWYPAHQLTLTLCSTSKAYPSLFEFHLWGDFLLGGLALCFAGVDVAVGGCDEFLQVLRLLFPLPLAQVYLLQLVDQVLLFLALWTQSQCHRKWADKVWEVGRWGSEKEVHTHIGRQRQTEPQP